MDTENPVAEAQQAVREMSGEEHVMPLASTAILDYLNAALWVGMVASGVGIVAGFLLAAPGSAVSGFSMIALSVVVAFSVGLVMGAIVIVRDMIRLQASIAVELRFIRKRLHAPAAGETAQNTPPPGSTSPSLR